MADLPRDIVPSWRIPHDHRAGSTVDGYVGRFLICYIICCYIKCPVFKRDTLVTNFPVHASMPSKTPLASVYAGYSPSKNLGDQFVHAIRPLPRRQVATVLEHVEVSPGNAVDRPP